MDIVKKSNFTPVIVLPSDTDSKTAKYEAWQKLRDTGMTVNQIAELFGVCRKTIEHHTVRGMNLSGKASGAYVHAACEARKAYYVPLMLELRKLGYSNVDIARITEFSCGTVYNYIGAQPDEISLASCRSAGAKRHFRNLARKNQPAREDDKPIPAVADVLSA